MHLGRRNEFGLWSSHLFFGVHLRHHNEYIPHHALPSNVKIINLGKKKSINTNEIQTKQTVAYRWQITATVREIRKEK